MIMARKRSETVRPFDHELENGDFMRIKNALFRVIMREVSGSAFKLLCAVEDASWGWQKEWAKLSYADLRHATGIGSDQTVREALNELLEKGYIQRQELEPGKGFLKSSYAYRTNSSLEMEVQVTTTEIKEEEESTSTKTVGVASTEIEEERGVSPLQKSKITTKTYLKDKKTKRKRLLRDGRLDHWACTEYRRVLELTVPKASRDAVIQCGEQVGQGVWTATLEGWAQRGYNPRGIPGIIDRATKGGFDGARERIPSGTRHTEHDRVAAERARRRKMQDQAAIQTVSTHSGAG